jgi:hypothetical protein
MTWASQAYNPGSNPGDRTFYTRSNTGAEKQQIKNRQNNDFTKEEEEECQIVFHC